MAYNKLMADFFSEIAKLGNAMLRKTRLSNAMGTPLAAIVIVTLPCLGIYMTTLQWPVLLIAAAPVIYFARAFDWLMKNDRSMLRTEEHEERMLQISVGLGEAGKKEIPENKVIEMDSMLNPTANAVSGGEEK